MADQPQIPAGAHETQEDKCYVALTNDRLDVQAVMDMVRSPEAGAIVVFVGKTHKLLRSRGTAASRLAGQAH